jgi:hypothetical protein
MHGAANSVAVLFLILMADFALTSFHSYQEWNGAGAPLWRNFGAIVGLDFPDRWGFWIFTVLLTVTLFAIGYVGIIGAFGVGATAWALGALIGARSSDTLISHVLLHGCGYRPNPGLSSSLVYALEAGFLAWMFWTRLAADPLTAAIGAACGAGLFVVVLPILWLVQWRHPALRRDRWVRWQPIPAWASTNP